MVVALPWILAIITYTIPEAPGIHYGWSINIFPFLSQKEEILQNQKFGNIMGGTVSLPLHNWRLAIAEVATKKHKIQTWTRRPGEYKMIS